MLELNRIDEDIDEDDNLDNLILLYGQDILASPGMQS